MIEILFESCRFCSQHYRVDHHCAMPEELVLLCRHIAATVGYQGYNPQAAIINYYHMDSTLAGHTDHSEFDLHSPLISVRCVGEGVREFVSGGRFCLNKFCLAVVSFYFNDEKKNIDRSTSLLI